LTSPALALILRVHEEDSMKRNAVLIRGFLGLLLAFAASCAQQQPAPPPPDLKAEEAAIRAASVAWGKAAEAKDLEKSLSYYAADAVILPPGMPLITDAAGRRKMWESLLGTPGLSVTFGPTSITVSHHADLAYEIGIATETMTDKKGKATAKAGKYTVVWKKQPDGSWKVAADIFNFDTE
jgi:uncharacterized protein (TIGR02246 family)